MALKTGLHRIAQAIRWLSLGWVALGVGLVFTAEPEADFWGLIPLIAAMFVVPGALGWLLAWVVDGFANKEG